MMATSSRSIFNPTGTQAPVAAAVLRSIAWFIVTVMAFLRDAAVSLLRRAGIRQIAARLRQHAQDPAPAVALVLAAPTHA